MMTISDKLDIVRKHQLNAPVVILPLAKELGLKVFYVDDWDANGLSGMIKADDRSGDSGYSIYVNGKHGANRKRFTIAHEIAHYILHESDIGDGIVDDAMYRSGLTNIKEVEANRMAADILMPWSLLSNYTADNTLEQLANIFRVSRSAMSIRLGIPYESES